MIKNTMQRYSILSMFDSWGTGNYSLDKETSVIDRVLPVEVNEKFIREVLVPMGATHQATSYGDVYTVFRDSRHCTEYIYYKCGQ